MITVVGAGLMIVIRCVVGAGTTTRTTGAGGWWAPNPDSHPPAPVIVTVATDPAAMRNFRDRRNPIMRCPPSVTVR